MIDSKKSSLTHVDILALYQNKFKQTNYFFQETENAESEFNKYEWVKIKIKFDQIHQNLLSFVIAISEIFRFEIGYTQPEYRLSSKYILSKKVEQGNEVGQFRVRTLYHYWDKLISDKPIFWEGMGRVVFCKYLYQENDLNLYNVLVDKNDYFIGLDPETCFWSLIEKYHYGPHYKPTNTKVLVHNNTPFTAQRATTAAGKPIYLLQNKKRDFIGDMHNDDYEALPRIKHFYPSNWFFLSPELTSYTKLLSRDCRFLNEKHFSALKSLVTIDMKRLLIDLHIKDKKDQSDAFSFVSQQLKQLTKICGKSQAFMQYLQAHRVILMQVILYEINQFFKNISAYTLEDKKSQVSIQNYIYENSINQFSNLLLTWNCPLTTSEINNLMAFREKLQYPSRELVEQVNCFYRSQLMHYQATLTKHI